MTDDTPIFALLRRKKIEWTRGVGGLTQSEVDETNAVLADWKASNSLDLAAPAPPVSETAPPAVPQPSGPLTPRIALELVGHEAIVQEAYKDSVGVWTWSVGITSASGHDVDRYKDNPQPIAKCLAVYIWLLREKYLPDVLAAFKGRSLTEAQLGAALSFHYNTGAIKRASWVAKWLAGDIAGAKAAFMEWRRPPEIIGRRQDECDLFFDGKWSGDGKATIYTVKKPSYSPDWGSAKRVDITADLAEAMK